MAHFAQTDENNLVTTVVFVSNDDILDEAGGESESVGIAFLESLGLGSNWVQTSYNHNFRGRYAGIGFHYDRENDVFVEPSSTTP